MFGLFTAADDVSVLIQVVTFHTDRSVETRNGKIWSLAIVSGMRQTGDGAVTIVALQNTLSDIVGSNATIHRRRSNAILQNVNTRHRVLGFLQRLDRAMAVDFDWVTGSAPRYVEAYRRAIEIRARASTEIVPPG